MNSISLTGVSVVAVQFTRFAASLPVVSHEGKIDFREHIVYFND